MTKMDPEIKKEMIDCIRDNLENPGNKNPGITQYDVSTYFVHLPLTEIKSYLIELEKDGKLKVVKSMGPGLDFYLPV